MIFWHIGLAVFIVWFVMRGNPRVDYRIVAVASLVPDVIDKTIGRVLFRSQFDSGHLYAHTLLFTVVLFCVLLFVRGRIKRTLVLVPIGTLLHLAGDGMWTEPRVFWWPLFGTTFPPDPITGGAFAFFVPREPAVVVLEVIGIALLVWLFASHRMLSREGLRAFFKTGMLVAPSDKVRT